MPAPEIVKHQTKMGRRGRCTFRARWTATELTDFDGEAVLSLEDLPDMWEDEHYAVERIEYSKSDALGAEIAFDTIGGDERRLVATLAPESTEGVFDFRGFPGGCVGDPQPTTPGNVAIYTRNAADNEWLFLVVHFKINALKDKAMGVITA